MLFVHEEIVQLIQVFGENFVLVIIGKVYLWHCTKNKVIEKTLYFYNFLQPFT